MEKTKFLFLISLFLMIGLLSFANSSSFKCPTNYFINPTYECISCKQGQYLDLDGNCQCSNPEEFINLMDRTCRSCPSGSKYIGGSNKCDCKENTDKEKIYFNETAWECQIPISSPCAPNYYNFNNKCVKCPNGYEEGTTYCKCGSGEDFNPYFEKCSNTSCDDGQQVIFSYYYDKCVTCNKSSGEIVDNTGKITCSCPEKQFFNTLKGSCETLPDEILKENRISQARVKCKDENSILDLENNKCISCGEEAFTYNNECYCNDPTKKYDSEEKKCVSCGDHKARTAIRSNNCDACIENHYMHWYEEDGELQFKCEKCPYKSDSSGCVCKKTFEAFDWKSFKCIECTNGRHINEDTFLCECDDEDEFYDEEFRKCIKCPKGAVVGKFPFFYDDTQTLAQMNTCLCPKNQIYDRKNNKCKEACSETETFGFECLPCPEGSTSDGNKIYCKCTQSGKNWDYRTQTCKFNGEWSSSYYMKLSFGLLLLILLL